MGVAVWQTPEAPASDPGLFRGFQHQASSLPYISIWEDLRQLWKVGCGGAAPLGWVGWGSAAGAGPNFSSTSQEGQARRLSPYLIT